MGILFLLLAAANLANAMSAQLDFVNQAGGAYRYFMVFAHDPLEGTGAYAIDEFRQILGQIG